MDRGEMEQPTWGGHGSQLWWVEIQTRAERGTGKIISYQYIAHAPTAEAAREATRRYYTESDRLALLPIVEILVEAWNRGDVLPWAYDILPD